MITVHVYKTDKDIVVSHLDCVIARYPKSAVISQDGFIGEDDFIWFLEELLKGLGRKVEIDN